MSLIRTVAAITMAASVAAAVMALGQGRSADAGDRCGHGDRRDCSDKGHGSAPSGPEGGQAPTRRVNANLTAPG